MKLQAVSNRKLYLQIADQIRGQIVAGTVEPGQQLPSERDLATSLSVSRPTVREALIALEVAGLIEVRVGVGAFVRGPGNAADILPDRGASPVETMAVRRLLEPEAAALASVSINVEGQARLRTIVMRMRTEAAQQTWSPQSDRGFHMTIAEQCGNAMLRDMLELLWAQRAEEVDARFHQHLSEIGAVREHVLADHAAIATAILASNADAARQAMTQHLDFVAAAMLDAWE